VETISLKIKSQSIANWGTSDPHQQPGGKALHNTSIRQHQKSKPGHLNGKSMNQHPRGMGSQQEILCFDKTIDLNEHHLME